MPYVTERWLGGTLTNFRTIRERLRRLEELERLGETGSIKNYSKKMESQLAREEKKIFRNLNGLRTMGKLPGALVVIDTTRELNALLEAKALGIPTICLIDTDGNPDLADIPVPANDDSMRSIDIVIRELCAAALAGRGDRSGAAPEEMGAAIAASGELDAPAGQRPVRRSSRSQFRSDSGRSASSDAPAAAPAAAPSATTGA
jgi:small subunit ribosomal protein S2